jgi:glycosyltransferase involved in cell wall biosynthesis
VDPAVTVIMTVYNGEAYLAEAIESVLSQTRADFELIIVDDGSEDGTAAILAEAEEDPRVRVIRAGRLGRVRALNLAWKSGRAPYVANLDADDRAEPQRLERQLEYMKSHPGLGLLGTAATLEFEESGEDRIRIPEAHDAAIRRFLLRRNSFVHSSVMIPRHVLEEVGGYDETYRQAEDYDLSVRIAARYPVANLPDLLTRKRMTPTQYFTTRTEWRGRYRTQAKIRWRAWRRLSGRPQDLRYVVESSLSTIGEWAGGWRSREQDRARPFHPDST